MKHNIRINGEVKKIDFELGSGVLDKNGREIFEGDKVNFMNEIIGVVSRNRYGEFIFKDRHDNEFIVYMLSTGLEIVDD